MGLGKLLTKPLSGYPGGYKKMRRGFQEFDQTPPFRVPDDPKDRRSRMPPSGNVPNWRQQPLLPQHPLARAGGGKPYPHGLLERGALQQAAQPAPENQERVNLALPELGV